MDMVRNGAAVLLGATVGIPEQREGGGGWEGNAMRGSDGAGGCAGGGCAGGGWGDGGSASVRGIAEHMLVPSQWRGERQRDRDREVQLRRSAACRRPGGYCQKKRETNRNGNLGNREKNSTLATCMPIFTFEAPFNQHTLAPSTATGSDEGNRVVYSS